MHLITSLLILLAASRFLGRLFQAMGFFAITGEILAGFLLGPAIFNFIDPQAAGLHGIVDLGIFLLIFSAGLEIELKDFINSLKNKALLNGMISFLGAFGSGLLFGYLYNLSFLASLVIGLCFAITAIPVAIKFLRNVNMIDSKAGHTVMATAIVIEILALLVLGVSSGANNNYDALEYIKLISVKAVGMFVFFFFVMLVNKIFRSELYYIHRTQMFFNRLIKALGEEAVFGVGVLFVLLFSTISDFLGFHFMIGAFFGGLLLNKDVIGTNFFKSLSHTLNSITSHFLTPIFFAYLGLLIQTTAFTDATFIFAFIGMGYGAKIFSSWLGAKASGFSTSESVKMGLILNSRGTFDLIVADLALSKGYIDAQIFSILILFGVFSALFNPVLYRQLYKKSEVIK